MIKMAKLLEKEDYAILDEDCYGIKQSLPTRLCHNSRFNKIRETIRKYYIEGTIVDLACGYAGWNKEGMDVHGVDVSEKVLKKAFDDGNLSSYKVSDVLNNGLKPCCWDLVVCISFIEHIKHPRILLKEIKRILTDDGIAIIECPYESYFGLWKPLFWSRCFIEGYVKGKQYYRNGMGHINKFTPKTIIPLCESNGFKVLEIINNLTLTFIIVIQKGGNNAQT